MQENSGKVVLVLIDGMRPDGFLACGNPYVQELLDISAAGLESQTVWPSDTLPVHMSIFHSCEPQVHGVVHNIYKPAENLIDGLFEQLDRYKKNCAFFNTWEELRDLATVEHLMEYECINQYKRKDTDQKITDHAIRFIEECQPDFTFVYLGETDEIGHVKEWMSEPYLKGVSNALDCVKRIREALSEKDTMIVMADHGGHVKDHGSKMREDMTIPIIISGPGFKPGSKLPLCSAKDVAPTIAAILGVPSAKGWEGRSLCEV